MPVYIPVNCSWLLPIPLPNFDDSLHRKATLKWNIVDGKIWRPQVGGLLPRCPGSASPLTCLIRDARIEGCARGSLKGSGNDLTQLKSVGGFSFTS